MTLLIETADFDNIGSLLSYSLPHPRTRFLWTGDQMLFRPGLYLLFSFEKWAFGYNFLWWQVTGFVLHLIVMGQLLKILNMLYPSRLAPFLVLNVSVFYLAQEMVIWHHVSGYLLAMIFLLAALIHLVHYLIRDKNSDKHFQAMLRFFFVGCFTFEFVILGCLMIMFFLLMQRRWDHRSEEELATNPWHLLTPIVCYATVSLVDYYLRFHGWPAAGHEMDPGIVLRRVGTILSVLGGGILFPQFAVILPRPRAELLSFVLPDLRERAVHYSLGDGLNILLLAMIGVLVIYWLSTMIRGIRRGERQKNILINSRGQFILAGMGLLSFVLLVSYILMFGGVRTAGYIARKGLYHFYIIGLWLSIGGYCLFSGLRRYLPARIAFLKFLIVVISCIATFLHAGQCYRYNVILKKGMQSWSGFVRQIEHFVKVHKHEPGFSFDIAASEQGESWEVMLGDPIKGVPVHGRDYQFLFSKYVNRDHPKYYLVYTDKNGIAFFAAHREAIRYWSDQGHP